MWHLTEAVRLHPTPGKSTRTSCVWSAQHAWIRCVPSVLSKRQSIIFHPQLVETCLARNVESVIDRLGCLIDRNVPGLSLCTSTQPLQVDTDKTTFFVRYPGTNQYFAWGLEASNDRVNTFRSIPEFLAPSVFRAATCCVASLPILDLFVSRYYVERRHGNYYRVLLF